ncbi:MAG: GNAT family N-acetyltransferase, partial [Phycisphaerales bacterium]
SLTYTPTLEDAAKWLRESVGLDNCRFLAGDDGHPAASLVRIPMGQYFGGRSIAMLGIAGVAVPATSRGAGLAGRMMRACLREAAADGFAVSTLYPSTVALYRSVGYEVAGARYECKADMRIIQMRREKARKVVMLGDEHQQQVREVYAAFASGLPGMLDRGDYCWSRVRKRRDGQANGYGVVGESGLLEAYVFIQQTRLETGKQDLLVTDLAFRDAHAGRKLLGLLADFATMSEKLTLYGPVSNPLGALLPLSSFQVCVAHDWMLRIVHLKRAIETRGYSKAVRVAFDLEIHDDVIAGNRGRWTVRIEDGCAKCEPSDGTDRPTLHAGIGGFTPVYSGYLTALAARNIGLVKCDDHVAALLDGVFGAGSPAMADFF